VFIGNIESGRRKTAGGISQWRKRRFSKIWHQKSRNLAAKATKVARRNRHENIKHQAAYRKAAGAKLQQQNGSAQQRCKIAASGINLSARMARRGAWRRKASIHTIALALIASAGAGWRSIMQRQQ
jgi:hypothetical protein